MVIKNNRFMFMLFLLGSVLAGIDPAVEYFIRPYKSNGYLSAKEEDKAVIRLVRKKFADKVRVSESIYEKGLFFIAPNNEGDKVFTINEDDNRLVLEKLTYNQKQKFALERMQDVSRFAYRIRQKNSCVDFMRGQMIAELNECDNTSSQIFEIVPSKLAAPDAHETEEEKKEREKKQREKFIEYPPDPNIARAKDLEKKIAEDPRNLIHARGGEIEFKDHPRDNFDFRKFSPALPARQFQS